MSFSKRLHTYNPVKTTIGSFNNYNHTTRRAEYRPVCRDVSYLSYSHLGLLLLLAELLLEELELVVHGERRVGCQLAARWKQHLWRSQQDGGIFTKLQYRKASTRERERCWSGPDVSHFQQIYTEFHIIYRSMDIAVTLRTS